MNYAEIISGVVFILILAAGFGFLIANRRRKSDEYIDWEIDQRVYSAWSETHDIRKVDGLDFDLQNLQPGQLIVFGGGKRYYFILTEK